MDHASFFAEATLTEIGVHTYIQAYVLIIQAFKNKDKLINVFKECLEKGV